MQTINYFYILIFAFAFSVYGQMIQEIKTSIQFDEPPTAQQIAQFLEEAYQSRQLINPDFRSVSCYQVRDIKGKGGGYTKLLFEITSNCSAPTGKKYILKESAGDEIYHVMEASQIPHIETFKDEHVNPRYPCVILPIAYLSYSAHGHTHIFSLMPHATGEVLGEIARAFYRSQIKDQKKEEELTAAYRQLGFQMANFYQFYMQKTPNKVLGPTIRHGDPNVDNIFFDKTTQQITLIDNASMKNIKEPNAIGEDLMAIIMKIAYDTPAGKKFLNALIEGFMQVFPEKAALQELIAQFADPDVQPELSLSQKGSVTNAVKKIVDEIAVTETFKNLLTKFNTDLSALAQKL